MATSQRCLTPLARILREEIRAGGPMSFCAFMSRCLYDAGHGFYATGARRIGRRGDFFTSVSAGPVFGELLAEFVADTWERLGEPPSFSLIEAGAHDGSLAADILTALSRNRSDLFDCLDVRLIEPLDTLRAAQAATLDAWRSKVRWVDPARAGGLEGEAFDGVMRASGDFDEQDKLEACPERSDKLEACPTRNKLEACPTGQVIIANELLDAFPVERVRFDGSAWRRLMVGVDSAGDFVWIDEPIRDAALDAFVRSLGDDLPPGWTTEFCPALDEWCASMAAMLSNGSLLVIDYGREAADYLAAHRTSGALRGYHRHRRLDDPFAAPGETDLTADVNFTHLRAAARSAGLDPVSTQSQERFLTKLAATKLAAREGAGAGAGIDPAWLRQFHTLTHPGLMGAAFHVLEFHRSNSSLPVAPE